MKSKEIKESLASEEVSPIIKIHKKMKPMLEEFKDVAHNDLQEGLLPMRDIQHYGTSIHHDFKYFFLQKELAKDRQGESRFQDHSFLQAEFTYDNTLHS